MCNSMETYNIHKYLALYLLQLQQLSLSLFDFNNLNNYFYAWFWFVSSSVLNAVITVDGSYVFIVWLFYHMEGK